MGSGIAEVSARAGVDVVVYEVNDEACDRGRQRISASVERAVKAGKLDAETRDEMLARISITTDFADFADRELVIEAIAENEEVKLQVFATLDAVVTSRDAILASNTSSIPIMKLAMATSRPEHVVGLHFFNPVPVLNLVELVPSLLTSPPTAQAARAFASEQLNKLVIDAQDRAGFIVNALLVPYLLSAIRMLESGFATASDIDTGTVVGLAHPMGPLALSDLIGLDTVLAIANSLYEEFRQDAFTPPPMLLRMVEAGLLGRKSGRGFYTYPAR
jgi:3-hydroxybutyryl-CoA dehydrogenase